jgi:hypothetical protein
MDDITVLQFDQMEWEPFDPQAADSSPEPYDASLTGEVQWGRKATAPPIALQNGSIQLTVLHMKGDPTPWFDIRPSLGVMILLEGSAEVEHKNGEVITLQAPCMSVRTPEYEARFRYLTPYRGIYVVGW